MKKLLLALFAVLALMAMNSCEQTARVKLSKEIEVLEKRCPVDLGIIGVLSNVTYDKDENKVVFQYLLNEQFMTVSGFAAGQEECKRSICAFFRNSESKKAADLLIEAGASFEIQLKGKVSGEESTILIPADEFKELVESDDYSEEDQLEAMVDVADKQCPQELGQGLIMDKVFVDNGYVVYSYQFDTNLISFSDKDPEALKSQVQTALVQWLNSASGAAFKQLLIANKTGVKYVYNPVGENGEVFTIVFEPEEIASL